jgi:hypothetical protein
MEKESSGQRPVEANSTGGQGSHMAVAPSDDDDDDDCHECENVFIHSTCYSCRIIIKFEF